MDKEVAVNRERVAATVKIRAFKAGDEGAFRALNEEWITLYFTLETKDRETLEDPWRAVLGKGGHILMAVNESEPVGCAALIPLNEETFELSKMAVSPALRGLGIGRRLLEYTIAEARRIGARRLFLGSSTKLPSAVHLYESVGFQHLPLEAVPAGYYARANVVMEMML